MEKVNFKKQNQANLKIRRIIYYLLVFLEILFIFRLGFKVLGANPHSPFVAIIYSVTNIFLAPFVNIFRIVVTEGIETKSVLEPTLIIGMIVYASIAWGIVKLIEIMTNRKDSEIL